MSIGALSYREVVNGQGMVQDTSTNTEQMIQFGQGPLPSISTVWIYGTGANANAPVQVNADCMYLNTRTVSATTYDNVPLYGTLKDAEGNTLNLTKVKRLDLILTAPTGSNPLYVGPQAQTNAWSGTNTPFPGGSGSTVYVEVFWHLRLVHPFAGYSVSSTSVLPVYNPNGSSVSYTLWIFGDE